MTRDRALFILRDLRAPLEARGIAHAALFGSVARDDATERSDVDVVLTPAEDAHLDLFDLGAVQTILDDGFKTEVDVIIEPVRKAALQEVIRQERANAF